MRADAQPPEARRGEGVERREPFGRSAGMPPGKAAQRMCGARSVRRGSTAPAAASPASSFSFSIAQRAAIAAWPQPAIISMPTAAISRPMKWSRSPMSKRRAVGA